MQSYILASGGLHGLVYVSTISDETQMAASRQLQTTALETVKFPVREPLLTTLLIQYIIFAIFLTIAMHLQPFCQLLAGKVFEQLAMGSGIFHIIIAHGFYISRTEYRTSVFRESIRSTFATLDASWSQFHFNSSSQCRHLVLISAVITGSFSITRRTARRLFHYSRLIFNRHCRRCMLQNVVTVCWMCNTGLYQYQDPRAGNSRFVECACAVKAKSTQIRCRNR